MSTVPLSLEDIDTLGELLARIPDDFAPMEPDMLDGFLTAITLMKHPPEQNEWMPYIFDLQANPRAKLQEPDNSRLKKLILRRGSELEATILSEKPIDPILFDFDEETGEELIGEDSLASLSPFADGFVLACSLWPELIKNKNKAVQAGLVGIIRWTEKEAADDAEIASIQQEIDTEVAFADLDEALEDLQACVQEIAEVTRGNEIKSPSKKSTSRRHSS